MHCQQRAHTFFNKINTHNILVKGVGYLSDKKWDDYCYKP